MSDQNVENWGHIGKEGHAHLYKFKEINETDKEIIYVYRCFLNQCRNEKWYRHKKDKILKLS